MSVTPYSKSSAGKKEQVAQMFNNIAPSYDFLNHVLSMGIDKIWRRRAIRLIKDVTPLELLDVATGTGDFALEALKLKPHRIVGVDLSAEMLKVAKQKVAKRGVENIISLVEGDSENLPFEDETFNAITVAFGVRNFENLNKGLCDMNRVMRVGGKLVVLEFSNPNRFPVKQLYNFYFFKILPFLGGIVAKDKDAYTYLPESVKAFPDGEAFEDELRKAGFAPIKSIRQALGIATIYFAEKVRQ